MFARLFPSEGKVFFELFERHAEKTVEAAHLLRDMLKNPTAAADQARRIKQVEHEGDQITHRAVEVLHRTFVTPIDRGAHSVQAQIRGADGQVLCQTPTITFYVQQPNLFSPGMSGQPGTSPRPH